MICPHCGRDDDSRVVTVDGETIADLYQVKGVRNREPVFDFRVVILKGKSNGDISNGNNILDAQESR